MLAVHDQGLLQSAKVKAEYAVSTALELEADALFRIGKSEQGIAKLQRFSTSIRRARSSETSCARSTSSSASSGIRIASPTA
jgi:hypothetical protein